MADIERVIYRRPTPDLLSTTGNADSGRNQQSPIYEGLVVDVILDHLHPQYSRVDGYNVGTIKVRIFNVDQTSDDNQLPWAEPLDNSLLELPLIGELVVLIKIRDNFFYTTKVPIAHRVQENGMLKLNDALNRRPNNTLASAVGGGGEVELNKHKFGEYWRPDSRIRPLKHFEGDTLIQGRMGSSIRFGSSKVDPSSKSLAPNIILRTGQGKDLEKKATTDSIFGLILEDINKDASSIWMVADQAVPFEPTTIDAGSFYRSISNPVTVFDKASIIINSDRVVINSKKNHIMMFSNEEIYINSFKRTAIDTDDSILLTANIDIQANVGRNFDIVVDEDFTIRAGSDISLVTIDNFSTVAKKIYMGSVQNDVEPVPGGTSLAIFLARLIAVLMGPGIVPPQLPYQASGAPQPITAPPPAVQGPATFSHVITPVGPGQLNPNIIKGLQQLYSELNSTNPGSSKKPKFSGAVFNSYDVFLNLANENATPVVEKNKFEKGKQVSTENNKWLLSGPYYKVI